MTHPRSIEGQDSGVKLVSERHPVDPESIDYYVSSPRHPREKPRFANRQEAVAYFQAEIKRVRTAR